ncbi:DUF6584 family protein [Cellulomonas sp. S1-8]|uniref:DUF6584 family protein n=1 Tax=Cellulomonas sp. S1-8 TaxID=2904790 RepID=UPI002244996D|nr:DUF6584 family protein [Cellulomonas sp. S1-8]UZN02888.1 hypothetical protein OKX07_17825 [Cellulomonas sp. S1-8]
MTVERTLAKVDEDLRLGDVEMARTRLRSLVQSLPHRLDARDRLADVYRLEGNLVEAGRWSYLGEDRDPEEVAAFERACGDDAVRIMRALRWRGPEDAAGTEAARQRLLDVRTRAQDKAGRKLDWETSGREAAGSRRDDLGTVGCLLGALVLVALMVVGAVTVVGWVL